MVEGFFFFFPGFVCENLQSESYFFLHLDFCGNNDILSFELHERNVKQAIGSFGTLKFYQPFFIF